MPLRLRSARADDSEDIPLHYESLALRPGVRAAGWAFGVAAVAGGITVMVVGQGTWVEVIGAVVAAAGGAAIAGLIRCGRFETMLGRRWLLAGAGPLRRRVAPDSVDSAITDRASTGWRRLYAGREEVLELAVHGARLVIPTRDPGALGEALPARGETGTEGTA